MLPWWPSKKKKKSSISVYILPSYYIWAFRLYWRGNITEIHFISQLVSTENHIKLKKMSAFTAGYILIHVEIEKWKKVLPFVKAQNKMTQRRWNDCAFVLLLVGNSCWMHWGQVMNTRAERMCKVIQSAYLFTLLFAAMLLLDELKVELFLLFLVELLELLLQSHTQS